ncbi:MAG: hypothetical protein KF678_12355 [Phycisphaeraceae bacterium]|nr:hypothetical protein [Phycisphaeraceae bacterium]
MKLGTCAAVVASLSGLAAGQVVDTFEGGVNQGGWAFGGPSEFISPTGGNPGAYLRTAGLDTTIPWLRCQPGSPFTGDFRAMGVTGAVVDINVFSTDFNIGPFPFTVILRSDNGTPANPNDDWAVFRMGDAIPAPGSGWKRIAIAIPAAATSLPPGWGFLQFGPGSPPAPDWNGLITRVSRLEFSFGDPELFYIFQMWTVGADNVTLNTAAPCYANCDNSTGSPVLTANDFQCFLNKYASGDAYANCDQSTGSPLLTANDFQCFLNKYASGCN